MIENFDIQKIFFDQKFLMKTIDFFEYPNDFSPSFHFSDLKQAGTRSPATTGPHWACGNFLQSLQGGQGILKNPFSSKKRKPIFLQFVFSGNSPSSAVSFGECTTALDRAAQVPAERTSGARWLYLFVCRSQKNYVSSLSVFFKDSDICSVLDSSNAVQLPILP